MLFLRKSDQTIWKPSPLLREPPPLSTIPPISEQFFHDPTIYPNFKNENPPLILGRGGNYVPMLKYLENKKKRKKEKSTMHFR